MHARFFRLSTLQVVVWQDEFAGKPQGRSTFVPKVMEMEILDRTRLAGANEGAADRIPV